MVHYKHIHYEMVRVYDVNLNVVHILAMYLNQQEVNYIDQFQDDIQVIEHDSKHQIQFHHVLHNIN
jgi:hypothetical protein